MNSTRIPLTDVPSQARFVEADAIAALYTVMESGRFIGGSVIAEFETTMAEYHGAEHAIACDSGSAALMTAMYACGVVKGVKFATPSMTFISVVEAANFLGAIPVYQDVMAGLWLMHPHDYSVRLHPDRKCEVAIPVALYGMHIPPGFYHHKVVIVDAAQASGQKFYEDFLAMTLSFFPGKVLGAFGDGGAILTNDEHVAQSARAFVNHGRLPGEKYAHNQLGFNFRMDAFQASILKEKYRYLDVWLEGRRQVAEWYTDALESMMIDYESFGPEMESAYGHSWHLYVLYLDETVDRDKLVEFMLDRAIEVGVHYPIPLHEQELYESNANLWGSCAAASSLAKRALSLPIFPEMTEEQVGRVVDTLKEGFERCKKEE